MTIIEASSPRVLPQLTDANRAFWTGGASGQLLVSRCIACRRWVLPPCLECPACEAATSPEPVSGRAKVWTWTLNTQQFHPGVQPPNLIAIVVLDEQEDLRVVTNLIECEEGDVRVGMTVTVRFEDHGEIFYPVFTPSEPVEEQ